MQQLIAQSLGCCPSSAKSFAFTRCLSPHIPRIVQSPHTQVPGSEHQADHWQTSCDGKDSQGAILPIFLIRDCEVCGEGDPFINHSLMSVSCCCRCRIQFSIPPMSRGQPVLECHLETRGRITTHLFPVRDSDRDADLL